MTQHTKNSLMALADAYAESQSDYVDSYYCCAGDSTNLGDRMKEARAALSEALDAVCRDADAFRTAVRLGIAVTPYPNRLCVSADIPDGSKSPAWATADDSLNFDMNAAACIAIDRAAAAMKESKCIN